MTDDKQFMNLALELAARGRGKTSPNPMVGAVIVKDGKIMGRGYHRAAGSAHAEVNAIDDAGDTARGATLYVTLEPCNHTGRTPPCTEKILAAGIHRVVVAMADPNPDVRGGGSRYLSEKGIAVTSGICEKKARLLNEVFIKYVTTGRPFVTLKWAATLDGQIATRTGDSRWVTGAQSRAFVHDLRHASDAILVGINTVKQDNPSLTTRLENGPGKDPARIVLDTHLSIPASAKMLHQTSGAKTFIITGPDISAEKRNHIERLGARVIRTPLKKGGINIELLMDRLGEMNVTSLLIEGGGKIIASALAAGIVDKVNLFYAPKILGGDDGVPVCRGSGPKKMNDSIRVKDVRLHQFGEDIMLEGYL
jgi:diaminohydroxyphosphoribosylaminopyrimidine deaminase/5-amino-6-(5-phosphoribosylamino)uracil reductase